MPSDLSSGERFPQWYTDALDRERLDAAYKDFDEAGESPEPCPMGCGRTTEDPYGGPCEHCWEQV